ncbi:permease prefix domain 1-containing protein [Microbacterium sp. NPDC056044]|uniref:permease prefix domain 1-containing protein n=1 Tax=Microbacterium sp. NPDC056044 TaxID=3345690 RepID=UPI0035D552E4
MTEDPRIEEQISTWRAYVSRPQAIDGRDVDELEDHLRGQIDRLEASGLDADEAFLVAVKRLGGLDDLSREFAREHSERLWKQLMFQDEPRAPRTGGGLLLAVGLAVGAALAVQVPVLFGVQWAQDGDFFARFFALLVLPFLAAFFLTRRRSSWRTIVAVGVPFVLTAAVLALYPFAPGGATLVLASTHAAVVLWLVTGIAYVNGRVGSSCARMDFIRFTGEWVVYLALIALGGGVLIALTVGVFAAIDIDVSRFVTDIMLPSGIAGAVIIAAWLVEAKQSVIENIAPVLTKLFTPLFTLLLLAFIVAGFIQGNLIDDSTTEMFGQRDLLILFDIVLVVVVGLLLYALSAREPLAPPSWFDRMQLLMIVAALVVDIMVLVAMIGRIAEWGASPNKLASLGLNVILLANLVGAGWLQLRFTMRRAPYERLERWQTAFVPVYLAWAAIVVVVFPPLFGFV